MREIRTTPSPQRTLLWFGLTFFLLGSVALIMGVILREQSRQLIDSGVMGKATVESKFLYSTQFSSPPKNTYRINLKLSNMKDNFPWDIPNKTEWDQFQVGDVLTIFYSPNNPKNFVIGDDNQAIQLYKRGQIAVYVGLGIATLGLIFLFLNLLKN